MKRLTGLRRFSSALAVSLLADPLARVGGPALASSRSPILPALLDFCATNSLPLDFVSWHIYSSSPGSIRSSINYVKDQLKKYPGLKLEMFLDEWNMDLFNPPMDPRCQPCYVAESIWQMKDAGLDYSCYYQLRDYYVNFERFEKFMSNRGAAFMTRWWNRMPQFDGLFDYQNNIRPAYFAFKLLSRLAGDQLKVTSTHPAIHGFATRDDRLLMENLLLWNFSDQPVSVAVSFAGLTQNRRARHIRFLDPLNGRGHSSSRCHLNHERSVPAHWNR